jgi:hypothetical protein
MTDVNEWAKREAERLYAVYASDSPRDRLEADQKRHAFISGAEALAALMLSGEAVDAAAQSIWDYKPERYEKSWEYGPMRAALRAALTAITERDA